MRVATCITAAALALASTMAAIQFASAGVRPHDVTTVSQNTLRDGWDPNEPGLSPATVGGGSFGQLFATHVDAQVYAQPLIVDQPTGGGGPTTDVIVATENNTVYSLNGTTGAVQWTSHLDSPWLSSVNKCGDINPLIGITSTPVYDPASQTLYVVAVTTGGNESIATPTVKLFALDEQTGTVKWNTAIGGSPVNAPKLTFNAAWERQRPGLLMMNGWVYMGFGSYCDFGSYVGYVAGVHTTDHSQTLWSAETGSASDQAGIWHAGGGLVSDGPGRIFLTTGNGVSPAPSTGSPTPSELGDSVVRLSVGSTGVLSASDFFSPANAPALDQADVDFGSGGPMVLPFTTSAHAGLLVQAGKDGRVFLLDTHALGGRNATTDHPVSMTGPYGGQWGHPAAFGGSGGNDYVYYVGENDYLRVLKFDGSNATTPVLRLTANSPGTFGYSSGSPVVTSNGTDPASAIVWNVATPSSGSNAARLQAFLAVPGPGSATLTQIWSAPVGQSAKFAVAATDSGRVYVASRNDGTDTTQGVVYGFGVSSAMPLLGKQVDFTAVGVGSPAKQLTATISATQDLQVTGVTGSSPANPSPFTLDTASLNGTPVAGFPVSLKAGDKLTVPVTFTPGVAGSFTGSVDVATNVPGFTTVSIPLLGTGAAPGLAAYPATLAFGLNGTGLGGDPNSGPVPLGATQTFTTDIVNTNTTAETISSVTPPSAPFTMVTGLAANTVLQPGQAVPVTVTYKPAQVTSSDAGSLSVTSADGTATVPLTGISVAGSGLLTASTTSVNLGNVQLGKSATATVTLTNAGNLPVNVTSFAGAPAPFGTPQPVAPGLGIHPGDTVTVPVTFTPQSRGTVNGQVVLTTTDGQSPARTVTINVTGIGVAPSSGVAVPSPGGGWTLNGTAAMLGTTLQLTPAATQRAGSAVYNEPLSSNGLRASFTVRLSGGTGADGIAFAMINPGDTPTALGGPGQLLGYGGMHGVAVVLGTHKDAGFPSANFVGISTGTSAGHLVINKFSTAVPNLRSGTHKVGVAVAGKTITVTVDGKTAVALTVAVLPTLVMPAFTASTGAETDVHAVSGVSLAAGIGAVPPPGGGWSYNGAAMSKSDTYLTHAAANQRGAVIYPRPVSTTNLSVTFNVQIGGGNGANGMTFALLDPTTPVSAVGANGAGMGLAGLKGTGVELSTFQAPGNPSDNFIAITFGTAANGQPNILRASGAVPPLRTGTHTLTIAVAAGFMTVTIDGATITRRTMGGGLLQSKMLLAFTGATGGRTDNHIVRNAAITTTGF
jgi:hypothetical protein